MKPPLLQSLHASQPESAFDAAASSYDRLEAEQPEFPRIRSVTHRVLLKYFSSGSRLLELNCGTGTDAIALARKGFRVFATDASRRMIETASMKVHAAGLDGMIQLRQADFTQLGELGVNAFDGAYSNFGGLNCTQDLEAVAANLARLVRPGGYFIATVMPRLCLWEATSMVLRFNMKSALRRSTRGGTIATVEGKDVRTFYHSPSDFRTGFEPEFTYVAISGLNVFTPPPGHTRAYRHLHPVLPVLRFLDRFACRVPLLRSSGDHYIMVLRKR